MRIGSAILVVGTRTLGACASSTGRAGTRSRGTNGAASFRNTAVEFTTAESAGDVLDAVPATTTPGIEGPQVDPPVIVPATLPTVELPPTTTDPQADSFPPSDEDWAEHRLARLAPVPGELGPGWEYEYGSRSEAEPADPDDAIEGCDAPVPPTLDGYDLEYRNRQSEEELSVMVGDGTAAESQVWIDALRAIAGCDLDEAQFFGTFDLVEGTIDGVDDAVFIAGTFDFGADTKYVQVIGAGRVDGLVVAAFIAVPDAQGRRRSRHPSQ